MFLAPINDCCSDNLRILDIIVVLLIIFLCKSVGVGITFNINSRLVGAFMKKYVVHKACAAIASLIDAI